jgi:acyl-coenzyme A synthetase/AMP-(fatty) acid ligase
MKFHQKIPEEPDFNAERINRDLNPRFKTHDPVFSDALPKMASTKIIRGALRSQWKGT